MLRWLTSENAIRPGVVTSTWLWKVCNPSSDVQVLTNLLEPWQVGDQSLPLLHELVRREHFQETTMPVLASTYKDLSDRWNVFNKRLWTADFIFGRYHERCTTLSVSSTMTNSFYIVLTSDASRKQYPENKTADFTMQLTNQLHLNVNWEVAMMRIIYPY